MTITRFTEIKGIIVTTFEVSKSMTKNKKSGIETYYSPNRARSVALAQKV